MAGAWSRPSGQALALWVDDADTADFDVRLPRGALAAVRKSDEARQRSSRARDCATSATTDAAKLLVSELDLGCASG
jgi:hypothetical protein